MAAVLQQPPKPLTALDQLIDEGFKAARAKHLKLLAREYFVSASDAELRQTPAAQLLDILQEAWQVLERREEPGPMLRLDDTENGDTRVSVLLDDQPFIIDSLRNALNRLGVAVVRVRNAVVYVQRSDSGKLLELAGGAEQGFHAESLCLIRCSAVPPRRRQQLQEELQEVLQHVTVAVRDYPAMCQKAEELRDKLRARHAGAGQAAEAAAGQKKPAVSAVSEQETRDSCDFLDWLIDNHFTFLGYDEFKVQHSSDGATLTPCPDTALGVAPFDRPLKRGVSLARLTQGMRDFITSPRLIGFAKAPSRSKVHRAVYYDYVLVRELDARGRVVRQCRFIGLYTSAVYFRSALEIPLLGRKVQRVLEKSGFSRGGHLSKDLLQVINLYPRDELFQIDADELLQTSVEIARIQDTRTVRLFIRKDIYGRFFSCLIFVPRDNYSTDVRLAIRRFLEDRLQADEEVFNTFLSEESVLVRIHSVLHSTKVQEVEYDRARLERELTELLRPWQERFLHALQARHGNASGQELYDLYHRSFPAGYRADYEAEVAVEDLEQLRRAGSGSRLQSAFSRSRSGAELSFKILNRGSQLHLSDVDPILENLGLKIVSEKAFPLRGAERKGKFWLHDFSLYRAHKGGSRLHPAVMRGFEEAFRAVWQGRVDDDRFNALVITAALHWREASLLRAYAAYLKQIQFGYRPEFIADTLNAHPRLCRRLLAYFRARLSPEEVAKKNAAAHAEKLREQIVQDIDKVVNLSEDSVLRTMLNLMDATLRTNYFQRNEVGDAKEPKNYIAFKLDPRAIDGMPQPRPRFEIFVYGRDMEGVHLRGGPVARGGLRWSDRSEDYRTEVLGLVKAQQVKNAVIVPAGAKGCFIVKRQANDRQQLQQYGVEAYKTFISGMLDVTDNLAAGKLLPPPDVVRRDGDDSYLVVAADKGTATFSDIANGIAAEYKFWLGDGFASGGSNGYDHKAMGITARGAWVSVRRHFRELGIDVQKEDFSVIGIGDMSGDVFGNGMLLSRHIHLLAAFNHLHIFVDPDPDAAATFLERRRLFELPRSSWADFKPELISAGGGVFAREAKSVPISPQMQARFGIEAKQLTPEQLIRALLMAKADLLWNGGIGTYVKASSESHSDVGDKANDGVRVDAGDLGCRVVGEGGNLGLTQAARVEYGLKGGISITDFVDNSAGVDCSDHEVNIKILLGREVERGRLDMERRNELLQTMTDEVARMVLHNNNHQVLCISIANAQMEGRANEYAEFIAYLEQHAGLDRALEDLPGRDELEERIAKRRYLTRPEIAVLTSYTKMFLKQELPEADYIDDPYLEPFLFSAFPKALAADYGGAVREHPLRRQIIATQLANKLVNLAGPSFFYRMAASTGSTPAEVVKAALFSREVLRFETFWQQAEDMDSLIAGDVQIDVLSRLARLMRRVTRWLLRNRRGQLSFAEIPALRDEIDAVRDMLPAKLPQPIAEKFRSRCTELVAAGIPEEQAQGFISCEYIPAAITFVDVSRSSRADLGQVMDYYYGVNEALELHWLVRTLNQLAVANHWQALARETYLDELAGLQRQFCANVVGHALAAKADRGKAPEELVQAGIEDWMQQHASSIQRSKELMSQLRAESQQDYAVYAVILRELQNLAAVTAGAGAGGRGRAAEGA